MDGINRPACPRDKQPFCNSTLLRKDDPLLVVLTKVATLLLLKCLLIHQNWTSSYPGPSLEAPSTRIQSTNLGNPVTKLMKAGCSSYLSTQSLSSDIKSAACWAGFFGKVPDVFTVPTQISEVVSVAKKLYDGVCRVEGYLLT